MLKLRASGMPLVETCPGAARAPEVRIRETGEAAELGTATHDVLAVLISSGEVQWDEVPATAAKYGVAEGELRALVAQGRKLWHQVRDSFPQSMTEVRLGPMQITDDATLMGHVDAICVVGDEARIVDWKTGRKDTDYSAQMAAYAALVFADHPEIERVTTTLLWVRDGEIETVTMTRAQADAWVARVRRHVVQWDGVYHPGGHCAYCPAWHECKAAHAMARAAVDALTGTAVDALAEMDPADVVALYQRAALVAKVADQVRDAIRLHVVQSGPVAADGKMLTMTTEARRSLDPSKAWPVLEDSGFADEDFAACITMSAAKAEDVVKARAPKGKGASAARELAAKLDAAGAVRVSEIAKLTLKRAS